MSDKTSTSDRHISQRGILLSKLLTHNEYIHCSSTILWQKGQFSPRLTRSITICLVKEVLNDTFRGQMNFLVRYRLNYFSTDHQTVTEKMKFKIQNELRQTLLIIVLVLLFLTCEIPCTFYFKHTSTLLYMFPLGWSVRVRRKWW